MAVWLAEQVGATGQVVATDVDTRYLSRLELPNLEVVEHDILDDPLDVLGPGSFDLVCSRLMLFHLKGRQEQAIRQMAACLRPGGWLLDEDADWGTAAPSILRTRCTTTTSGSGETETGGCLVDTTRAFGQKLPALFERCGLQDIRNEASTEVVRGGSPWARWWIPTLEVINELGGGDEASRREVEVMTTALADPTLWLQRELLHACWGRRGRNS